jgi:hypothetical protein
MSVLVSLIILIVGSQAVAKPAQNYLNLDLRQNRYLGAVPNPNQESNYTLFATDLNLETQTSGFAYKFNPLAQGDFNNKDEFYLGVPEAYVQPRKIAPWFSLTIGRKKRTWSKADEEFNLGLWQPQLRWDYLAPVQQGLTGVFFDWQLGPALSLMFFTSPLAFPDQGPQYRLNNGSFESSNRWFEQPHSRLQFQGNTAVSKDAPLYFEIQKPTEEEIIMHSSFGFGVRYGASSQLWTNLNYAYKPRNQIHLGIECSNCAKIGSPQALEVTAVIHPKIVKHHVLTWEMGFDRTDDHGWVSITGDVPNKSGFPDAYQEAPLDPMMVFGAGYSHYVLDWIGKPSWLGYSYMRVFELNSSKKSGLFDDDQVKSSLDRYPFKDLASVDLRIQLSQKKSNIWSLRNRYSYSIPERGGWLSTSIELTQGSLSWTLGADILGAEVDSNSDGAGLFSTYRANDRFFGGVSYVF